MPVRDIPKATIQKWISEDAAAMKGVPKKRKAKITVKVFLDSSVLLSASASEKGASRYVIENAKKHRWQLVSSHYCREETFRNLSKLGAAAEEYFGVLILQANQVGSRHADDR